MTSGGTGRGHTASGPWIERRLRPAAVPHLDDEAAPAPFGHVLHEEERQLGGDRLELDVVERIVDQRGHRHDGLGILRLAQQPHRAEANLRIGIAQVANDVVEPRPAVPRGAGRSGESVAAATASADSSRHEPRFRDA